MLKKPDTQTDPTNVLGDLADAYGWTPFILFDDKNYLDEYLGHFSAAPAFVNAVIAEAEPLFQSGNRIGVQAAMLEIHCWLETLRISDAWEMAEDLFIEDEDEHSPGVGLPKAIERAREATQRYAALLTDRRPEDDRDEMASWRVMAMPCGHVAALEHHIARLRAQPPRLSESHNAALHVSLNSLAHALHHLEDQRREKRAGIGPSKRAVNRRIGRIRAAISQAGEAQELITSTVSITFSDHVQQDDAMRDLARQLGDELRKANLKFMIGLDTNVWENSLLAHRNLNGSINVKRIVDHYDGEIGPDEATEHALAMMSLGEDMVESGVADASAFLDLAGLVLDNAYGCLHDVDRTEFDHFMEQLHRITDDPRAIREAALVSISDEYNATDLLFAQSRPAPAAATSEQARSVVEAGRGAGMSEGQLRALAAVLGFAPERLGVASPSCSGEQLVGLMEIAPEPLSSRQVHRLARVLGADLNDAAVQRWVLESCYDAEQDEPDDCDEDDGLPERD